jgi:hypothetical protein
MITISSVQNFSERLRQKNCLQQNLPILLQIHTEDCVSIVHIGGLGRLSVLGPNYGGDYEECRLLGYKTQSVLHRRHISSPLQSPAS